MDNSCPLPDGPPAASQQPSRGGCSSAPVTASLTSSHTPPRQHDGLSHQSRRLQLRNAGFRGAFLPARRISPIFRSQSYPESHGSPVNNENSAMSPERRTLYGEDMPPSPVNILQEIQNSSKGRKKPPRPGLGNIFQDQSVKESSGSLTDRSWYNESSNTSPVSFKTSPVNMMKLRESSMNQKTPPPLSSPLTKQMKGPNVSRVNSRSSSFEASKYIEHLESQLTTLNAKLDTLVSPNTNKARAAKLRALTVEARSLRHELAEWEKNFADRVKEGIEQGLEIEASLKGRMQAAEDEAQLKDSRIKELEYENETLRMKLKDTESLEITNANLEKRVDVLTSLLVQSPTKLEFTSAASSPSKSSKVDFQRRTPRPCSVLSPAGGVRLSLSTIGESAFWNSKASRSNSSFSESPDRLNDKGDDDSPRSPEPMTRSQHVGAFDEDSGASSSQRSVTSPSSRPTSLHSSSSWGLPFATDRDSHTKFTHRQRRMRRFPSGSGTLKPLILPSAAGTPSLPASAPVYQASDVFKRDISNFSLDPTSAFLSQEERSTPVDTPTQPKCVRPNTWEQDGALRLLEGRSGIVDDIGEDVVPLRTPPPTVEERFMGAIRESSEERERKRTRPRSLEEELKHAFLNASGSSFGASFRDGLIPVDGENFPLRAASTSYEPCEAIDDPNPHPVPTRLEKSLSSSPSTMSHLRQRPISPSSEITPKPPKPPTLLGSPPKSSSSTAAVLRNASGLCARLIDLMTRTKQDPVILAQRLLYNAWTLGSARLGGIGWWLLGVLFGFRSRNREWKTDEVTGEVQPAAWFDWRPYTAEASKRRTAECFLSHRSGKKGREPTPVKVERDVLVEPHVFPCDHCEEPSMRRTFRLWFQFSLTIVLAVGVAIRYGPGTLLVPPAPSPSNSRRGLLDPGGASAVTTKQQRESRSVDFLSIDRSQTLKPLIFAQILSPADFEGRVLSPDINHHRPS